MGNGIYFKIAGWVDLDMSVQNVKIYLPCNFEVNLITHLGVIALFSSIFFFYFNTFRLTDNRRQTTDAK
jgi:hypothetical protein